MRGQLSLEGEYGWNNCYRESGQLPLPDEATVAFIMDGVRYAIAQNVVPKERLVEDLKRWLPGVKIEGVDNVYPLRPPPSAA